MNAFSAPNVAAAVHDGGSFARLARARLLPEPPSLDTGLGGGDDDLNPETPRISGNLRHAAVLVPVIARQPLSVLLTARTDHLPSHAGQIAFPGGKVEAFDQGPLSAALRETREEIDLDQSFIEPLGFLPPYRTGTGYIITPSVALVRLGFELKANPGEVADVFEVPLSFLMNEANHEIHSRTWRGAERRFYAMPFGERYIWGATAGIIRALYRSLFSA
jgi:8-oxo-dGTP pyrophosphatase MutT (NUDIX family)